MLVGLLAISVYERFTVERDMAARLQRAQEEQRALEERRTELETRVDDLTGERGVETEIRRNFDVAKEGEQVVVIVDDESDAEEVSDPDVESAASSSAPWYQFWR